MNGVDIRTLHGRHSGHLTRQARCSQLERRELRRPRGQLQDSRCGITRGESTLTGNTHGLSDRCDHTPGFPRTRVATVLRRYITPSSPFRRAISRRCTRGPCSRHITGGRRNPLILIRQGLSPRGGRSFPVLAPGRHRYMIKLCFVLVFLVGQHEQQQVKEQERESGRSPGSRGRKL